MKENVDNENLKKQYKEYRNSLTTLIRQTKVQYYEKQIKNTPFNSKEMWKTMNRITQINSKKITKNKDPETISVNNITYDNKTEISNIFNQHYTNIANTVKNDFKNINEKYGNNNTKSITRKIYEFRLLQDDDVKRIIMSLKPYAAAGEDRIPTKIIRENCNKLVTPIKHIINLSLKTGKFPEIYKLAILRPIYKEGDTEDVNNYRPISLLSTVSKILEKAVKFQLNKFLEKNKFFSNNQLGFRNNMGTEEAINNLHIKISTYLDENKKCLAIFQDLSKAFDLVNHQKLIGKIERAGCEGKVLSWVTSYLENRKQRVRIGTTESEILTLKGGTPQGSALSPLLFLIYINDLTEINIEGEIISYADDTVIIEKGDSWEETRGKAEKDIRKVITWLNDNELILNQKKTKSVQFALKNKKNNEEVDINVHTNQCNRNDKCFQLNNNCQQINTVDSMKYLGIIIDKNLNWKQQGKYLAKKLIKSIFIAIQFRNIISQEVKRILYTAIVQSKIQYGISSWGAAYKTNLKPVTVNQKKFLKILYKKPKRFSSVQLFEETKALTLEKLHEISAIKYVKKHNLLTKYSKTNTRLTRNTQFTVTLPKIKTNIGKTNSIYTGLKNFNKLDQQNREKIIQTNNRTYKTLIRNAVTNTTTNYRNKKQRSIQSDLQQPLYV